MNLELEGKTALITGASKGIGNAISRTLAAQGCNLHLVARSEDALSELSAELRHLYGVRVISHAIDLSETSGIQALSRSTADSNVDVLVNNAGAIPAGNLLEVNSQEWRQGWQLKVFGYIDVTREFYSRMVEKGSGVILNNIGNGGENPDFDYIAGSSGNAALMSFTKALGGRSLENGVRVVGVNPGPVNTDRIVKVARKKASKQYNDSARYEEILAGYPAGRPAEVSEVADLFAFLASPLASYISGAIFTIDGGVSSRQSV